MQAKFPDVPKALVPVNGEPFASLQLKLLARQGVREVVLCVAHRSQQLTDFVGDGAAFGVHVQYSYDGDKLLGTGGALLKASHLVGSPFALLYGDSYLDIDFVPVYETFERSGKRALMTVYRNENQLIPSNMELRDGQIVAYNKDKPTSAMQHVDFGLSLLHAAAFEGFSEGEPFDLSAVWQSLIAAGQLAGYEVPTRFYEIGTPEGLHDLEGYLAAKESHSCADHA